MPSLSKIRIAILSVIILVALGAIGVNAIGLVSQQELSSEEAVSAVKGFAKVSDVKRVTKNELHGKRSVYEIVANDDRVFWVDAKTGKVTGVVGSLDVAPASQQELPLTKETARKRAEAYLRNKLNRFDELTLTKSDVDSEGKTVAYIWQKTDKNGARLPQWATLTVNLQTGELGGYASRDEETLILTEPKVSKEEALLTAKVKLSKETDSFTVNSQELSVMKDKNGQQRLMWIISYRGFYNQNKGIDSGSVSEGQIAIDAITGEIATSDFR